jgi:tripartite-type tricarboxylate transporter receptor subunit TctC
VQDEKNNSIDWASFLGAYFTILAQDFPTKPINILVGLAPGGVVDGSIRLLASKAEKFLGQPFVISNNGGGEGPSLMASLQKKSRMVTTSWVVPVPHLVRIPHIRPVPYKPEDFAPIMHFGSSVTGLVVKADAPYKTLKEFVEYAKKNPWKIAYATIGTGTPHHVAMEFIAKKEGIQWTMVPYPGGAPGLTALLGGHVSAFSGGTVWIPHVKEGTVRLLCTYNERRMKTFPEVTVLRELGYDYIDETVFMLAAPKGTPPSVLKKLDDAFLKAMDDLDFVSYMERIETELSYRNYVETKKYLEEAYRSVGKLIIELKIPKEDEKKP